MLSKVMKDNIEFGTDAIKTFASTNNFDVILDNQNGYLLVKDDKTIYLWNYNLKRKYNYNRIKLEFNNRFFFKQIESFDQNNIKQASIIRKQALSYLKTGDNANNILGIGGEYYIYFLFVHYAKYYGISNHMSIIEDAQYNCPKSINSFVDYNKLKSYPRLDNKACYDVILNVVNIHENMIKYICKFNINKVVIVICKPLEKKIIMLNKYLKLEKISHIKNINSLITICLFKKI